MAGAQTNADSNFETPNDRRSLTSTNLKNFRRWHSLDPVHYLRFLSLLSALLLGYVTRPEPYSISSLYEFA